MTNAIALLRKTADECERHARQAAFGSMQAELFDMAAEWHWLAGEAARLLERVKELEFAAPAGAVRI
jgi:hypothetical protein